MRHPKLSQPAEGSVRSPRLNSIRKTLYYVSQGGETVSRNLTRRNFLGGAAAAAAVNSSQANAAEAPDKRDSLPSRLLGRTGAHVPILAIGGGSRLGMYEEEDRAVEALNLALDLGIAYIDTAQGYGSGNSETWVGAVMADRRGEAFLASKIRLRGYDEAMRETEKGLQRLQTDRIDLLHIHSLGDEEDLKAIEAGSLRALHELRDQGVCRFIGITSHTYPDVLATALERHDFDCTQMALNAAKQGRSRNSRDPVATPPEDSFEAVALPIALRKGIGVIAMKVTGQESLVGTGEGKSGVDRLLQYAWSLPVATAVVGMPTLDFVKENAAIARGFKPMPETEMRDFSKRLSDANKHALDTHFCHHVDA